MSRILCPDCKTYHGKHINGRCYPCEVERLLKDAERQKRLRRKATQKTRRKHNELKAFRKLCEQIITEADNMLNSGVDCDYRWEQGRRHGAMAVLDAGRGEGE